MKLKGKIAVVTGAGQGIGRATAIELAKEGANLVVADVNFDMAKETAGRIISLSRQALAIKVNVSDSKEVRKMVEETMSRFKRVDILVNNAGVLIPSRIEDLSEEDWDRVVDVNLKGTFLCSQAFGQYMIKQKSGVIINIASISGETPEPLAGAYSPSKAGIIALTQLLAMEWARYNIRVNAVCPGVTRTALEEKIYLTEKAMRKRSKLVPLKRMALPEEIARLVVFLASDDSSYITGETINIDGGQLRSLFNFILPTQLGLKKLLRSRNKKMV